MQIITDLKKLKIKDAIVVLGTFDGVHKGHQQIIKSAVRYAWLKKKPSVVVTFDPHPQRVIAPQRGLRLLTSLAEREALIAELGVDYLVVIRFDAKLQKLSYVQFIKKILVGYLKASTVFVGFDFGFGYGRSGKTEDLRKTAEQAGIEVKVVRPVRDLFTIVKSSLIRECLAKGQFNKAKQLLGRGYILEGKVVKGVGRGRELGFPTANLLVHPDKLIPAHGVYAGHAWVDGRRYKAAIYIGSRPTFPEKEVTVETYLLNFNRNIVGKTLKLELLEYFHGDLQFSDVDELIRRIKKDIILVGEKRNL
ncbi:MAG: bifunctional riboflavin kinase/FAD synthetase [Candidatus Saganbacteria bacterium]|nr:bifunctional riboflavin kinase/FAD synthetase [Candidatus Saganbacteria bacterium]